MEQTPLLNKIREVEKDTKSFEASLHWAFLKGHADSHIAIQNVNIECQRLQWRIREVLSIKTTNTRECAIREAVVSTALTNIRVFETVRNSWIPLNWNVFELYGKVQMLKNKKNDKK